MRLRRRTTALITLAVVLLGVLPQLAAGETVGGSEPRRVTVDQWYPVPASGTYTIRGRGYGHGRGMSQYGARGAAEAGLSHEEILAFYYPGTTLGRFKARIRVLISADTTSDVIVAHRAGLVVRDLGAKKSYPVPTDLRATRWRITTDPRNRNLVEYAAGGEWHRWSAGGARRLEGYGEFVAPGPMELVTPSGTATYRGRLRAAASTAGSRDRDTVNVMNIDAYVRGVVPAEMPALWSPEAVQAQAVAARTYALWHRSQNLHRHYQVCDTTACQVYRGVDAEHPAGNAAVRATSRQVLRYDGAPAFTEFSSSSGGFTTASDIPYQVARRDPYDGLAGNPNHTWREKLSAAEIRRAYPSLGKLRGVRVTRRDGNGKWKGRVLTVVLDGRRGNVTLSGDDFRSVFGLRSTWFRL
jgi:stage II sporulation protein D